MTFYWYACQDCMTSGWDITDVSGSIPRESQDGRQAPTRTSGAGRSKSKMPDDDRWKRWNVRGPRRAHPGSDSQQGPCNRGKAIRSNVAALRRNVPSAPVV